MKSQPLMLFKKIMILVAHYVKLTSLIHKHYKSLTNTCIRIAKLLEDPKSKYHERDSYGYDDKGILYHINRENGREYKATVVPKTLVNTVLKEMHDHFGHFGILENLFTYQKILLLA